ncbi:hypothetical protein DZ860_21160 [Vibrio sinensis]|uniref:Uncharacterized protein n=1 Tax=Vibrio sinensis TaxID=2302434 RepID=A0A3A6QBV6_9VIBR|nr:hypothetical protein [Vibrio sinensis]RJX65871.1 hypothetical protein DZ860_21160 [Vibrio sinensis]
MYKALFDRKVFSLASINPTYQTELDSFIKNTIEATKFKPNKITLYSYRASSPYHVMKIDSQFEITITENKVAIPDLWNFQDGLRTGNVDIEVYDSVDVLYLIEAIIDQCRHYNPNLLVERTK